MRQLIAIEFAPQGRAYTYHNEGEPVALGDEVVVLVHDKPKVVKVVSIDPPTPKFETKAIVGKHDRPKEQGQLI